MLEKGELLRREENVKKRYAESWNYGSGVATDQIRPSKRTQKLLRQFHGWEATLGCEVLEIWTRSMQETEVEAPAIRRAKALRSVAESVSLCIQPWELIVGVVEGHPLRCIWTPDLMSVAYQLLPEIDKFPTRFPDPIRVEAGVKDRYEQADAYWRGKSMEEISRKALKKIVPEVMRATTAGVGIGALWSPAHIHLAYDGLVQKGISGLRREIEEAKTALDMGSPDFMDKSLFYHSLLTVCDAFTIFAERHGALAETLAAAETNEEIRTGYLKVAKVCRHVASKPAETLHQALQAVWFAQLLAIIESGTTSFGFGRMDQYLTPYYEEDVQTGMITSEGAQELLDCFWIKTAEPSYALPEGDITYNVGKNTGQQLDVGGVDADGKDASSEISYMMIQATMNTRLNQPSLGVLWHQDMPEGLAEKAVELTSLGTGHPSHFSSDAVVRMLMQNGLTEEEARQGCLIGCLEPQGKQGTTQAKAGGGWFNLGMALDMVFTNGVARRTQQQIGPCSGDPRTFDRFEDVLEAFKSQIRSISKGWAIQHQYGQKIHHQFPLPFESLLTPNCVKTGVDIIQGGAEFNFLPAATMAGIADYIDSMVAVKHLVFDEKKLKWDQLLHALDTDFEDMETTPNGPEIRRMCLEAPKYGNGDNYADGLTDVLMNLIPDVMDQLTAEGYPIRPGVTPMTSYVPMGQDCGAFPSGRKAFAPLADGISPKQGMDRHGPTATIRSVTSWCHDRFSNGTQFNMKFSPDTLKGRAHVRRFADLIRVLWENGGMHVQCNVISAETLKDAQEHPEKYPGLMVRVTGYSAQFADLDVTVQNDIISRTEHGL